MTKILLIFILLGAIVVTVAYICSLIITSYRTFTEQEQTPKDFGIDFSEFSVNTDDGVKLSCWHIPAAQEKAVMIVSHGVADGKSGLLHCVLPFLKSGFSVVMYDLRHHGDSTGIYCTLGYFETRDLINLTDYVKENFAKDKPIFYWGFSLGATLSILAAAKRKDIKSVVARSPFVSLRGVVKHYAWKFYYMPYLPAVPLALKFFEWKTGAKTDEVDIMRYSEKLKKISILLIGSENDKQVPLKWLEEIHDKIGNSVELLVGPYGHTEVYEVMESDGIDVERAISFLFENMTYEN